MEYLDPEVAWPEHSRPEARAALKDAAAEGWHFRKSNGHVFGTIKCTAIGQPGACTLLIYSTSGSPDGSATAKAIRRVLRKCPHRSGSLDSLEPALEVSDGELATRVQRLLDAIDGLDQRDRAEEGIFQAIERDDVGALDEQLELRDRGDNAVQIAVADLGLPQGAWPFNAPRIQLLAEAENLARAVAAPEEADRLLNLVRQRSH